MQRKLVIYRTWIVFLSLQSDEAGLNSMFKTTVGSRTHSTLVNIVVTVSTISLNKDEKSKKN